MIQEMYHSYPMSHSHAEHHDHEGHSHEGHSHSHVHSHYHGEKNIAFAFFLNLIFIVIEIVGGLATNSFAILSDALHDLGDTLSLGVSWYLERVSKRGKDARFSIGYRRFSLLAALINSLILMAGSFYILSEVIPRILHPHHADSTGMFYLAVVGITVHGVAAYRLSKGTSLNERSVSLHLLEDVFGWVAVLIASILIAIKDLHIIDPLLSGLITLYILYKVILNLKETLIIFLQGVPPDLKINQLQKNVLKIKGVSAMCNTNIWSLDGVNNVLTTHIVVDKSVRGEQVFALKKRITKLVEDYDIKNITIEMERAERGSKAHQKSDVFVEEHHHKGKVEKFFDVVIPKTNKGKIFLALIALALFSLVFFASPDSEEHEDDPNSPIHLEEGHGEVHQEGNE
jgi:cobalt-zinc-cadmium efflux system protein